MRLLRFSFAPLVAVFVSASSCGQEDETPPPAGGARGGAAGHSHGGSAGAPEGGSSGAAEAGLGGQSGSFSAGGTHAGGRGGGAGKSGSGGNGGAVEFGCTTSVCSEATLAGTCPAEPPQYAEPCAELGATCIYCFDSQDCAGEKEGRIVQCCPFGWASNCYNSCENPGPSSSTGGQGGQGGASGQSGAEVAGAGSDAGSCADLLTICCNANADCPSGFECANEPDGLQVSFGFAGTCRGRPADTSRCWVNADCPAHYRCYDALYCGCGYDCHDDSPGTCVPL